MTKTQKVIYWIATLWLASAMMASGVMQLLKVKAWTDIITNLHYPLYLMTILGVWKILGVIVLLIPKFPLLKEWAYAGFFFTMSGALFSHIAVGGTAKDMFPAIVLLIMVGASWYFRPASKKIAAVNP